MGFAVYEPAPENYGRLRKVSSIPLSFENIQMISKSDFHKHQGRNFVIINDFNALTYSEICESSYFQIESSSCYFVRLTIQTIALGPGIFGEYCFRFASVLIPNELWVFWLNFTHCTSMCNWQKEGF